jgi:hypothetical protein
MGPLRIERDVVEVDVGGGFEVVDEPDCGQLVRLHAIVFAYR